MVSLAFSLSCSSFQNQIKILEIGTEEIGNRVLEQKGVELESENED